MRSLSQLAILLGGAWLLVVLLGESFPIVVMCSPWAVLFFKLGMMAARRSQGALRYEYEAEVPVNPGLGSDNQGHEHV